MKVLFEGFKYTADKICDFIPKNYCNEFNGYLQPKVVGYHAAKNANSAVIILPKVFLNEENNFFIDDIDPLLFIKDNYIELINQNNRKQVSNFLFECASWFYFSIKKYSKKFPFTLSLIKDELSNVYCSKAGDFNTELDLVINLLKFNKENKDFFLLISKINNSQNSKINWTKSIRKGDAFIDDSGLPIYLKTLSKKKEVDIDESLLILFFTILNDLQLKYNIRVYINPYFKILSNSEYSKVKNRGSYYLKKIRYKYFSDKMLKLYHLIYSYLEQFDDRTIKNHQEDFLMIKDYNIVFQDMIDELLSDQEIERKLRKHKDDKELDHIYKEKSFFEEDEIYFIGDSKYYKAGNLIEGKSIYKQFTYAKNVIQHNIDLFNNEKEYPSNLKYRDELTEGYNITPNFFIKGIVNDMNFHSAELTIDSRQDDARFINTHFTDRLFDRDTLIVLSYSINFLFVIWAYISSHGSSSQIFKTQARLVFKHNLISYFNGNYQFLKITVNEPINEFIIKNFYQLNGKIYRPASFETSNSFILALDKKIDSDKFLKEKTIGNVSKELYSLS